MIVYIENKRSCGLHMQLGTLYKKVALGRIWCFCLSEMYSRYKRQQILHLREWASVAR